MTNTCAACHATKDSPRLPRGWKRLGENVYCQKCWQARYVLRAVTFPVAGPVDVEWPEFRETLAEQWRLCTAAANWINTTLYARDCRRDPASGPKAKMPAMKPQYLYPEIRAAFPTLPTATVVALDHAVQGKYRSHRYKIIWTGDETLANHRYPQPFVAGSQAWSASYGEDGERPHVSVRIGDKRITLRLRGGRQFRRQLTAFRQIVDGTAVQGEIALYRKRASAGDNRNGTQDRDSGGSRVPYRSMCKLVAWLPRGPEYIGVGELLVRTDTDSLLVALDAKGEKVWYLHADQVRRWEAEHRRRLNRWSDDQKAEQRPVAKFQSRREAAVLKYKRRMDSFCHEASAQLVAFAKRRRYAQLRYDDAVQSYLPRFPWFMLRERIATKCDAVGIAFERASGAVVQNTPAAFAEPEAEE